MDINSSLLRYNMLRNEQSVKNEDENNNKKVLNNLEITKKINEVLSEVTKGTLTVAEATKELKNYGILSQLTYQNGNEVLNVSFQGKKYSAMATKIKARTTNLAGKEILDSYIKDRVIIVADKAVNNVINNAVNGSTNNNSSQDTKSYTKLTLKNKYDLTENEIAHYFKKNLGLYKMNYTVIDKEFPGAGIENPKDLKEVITTGVNAPEQDTTSYAKITLQNKYGFTEAEINAYFKKNVALYKMNYEVINKIFPNVAIENPEDLKEVIEFGVKAYNYNGTTDDYINGLYTNSNLSKIQIKAYIDDFAKLLKKELSNKYSYNYLDSVLDLVKAETLEKLDTTLPVRQILRNFKNAVEEFFTQMKGSPYFEVTKGVGNNKKVVNFFEEPISPQELINKKGKILKSGDAKAQFLVNFLYNTAESLNLTSDERKTFFQKVFDAVAQEVGGYKKGESKLNFSKLRGLDKNKDGSWMDEFCAIVEKEANKINPTVDRNPTKLSNSQMWGITAEDFLYNLDDYLLHDDGGVRKFAQMIDEALNRFNCYDEEEAEKLITYIFNLLNEFVGVNSNGALHYKTIENLDEQGIFFEKLEEIIYSESLTVIYELDLDEQIGDFYQGGTGDCWLLSALISLKSSPLGKKIIENAISLQPNGDVEIHFAGVGKTYTITPMEILEAKNDRQYWAYGDDDVIAFEIATEKLRRDIAAGNVEVDVKNSEKWLYGGIPTKDDGSTSAGIWGGFSAEMIYFLTGQKSDYEYHSGENFSQKQIENFFKKYEGKVSNTVVLNFSVASGKHTATTVTGDVVTVDISTGHAFSITNIDYNNKTVTIVNPWDSDKEYTLTWAEFAKFGIKSLSAVDLSNVPV